jgi:hypothetical protein
MGRITAHVLVAGSMWLACGCGRSHAGTATPATVQVTARDSVVEGRVAVKGADPFAQVIVSPVPGAPAGEVAIVGALRSELATLHGAQVRVWGRAVANGQPVPRRAIEATGYEIVAINGERPYVGELVARQGGVWLADKRLVAAPVELLQMVGAKVWVVGRSAGSDLQVQSYGIIVRPPR